MSESPNLLKPLLIAGVALLLFYVVIPFLFSVMWKKDADTLRSAFPAEQKAIREREAHASGRR